jgi:NADH-quinone oxidoreductase subunit M
VAGVGVVLAAVYTIRLYQRSMHNPVGDAVESREMSFRDGLVIVPTVAAILVLALYPQLVLDRSEESVSRSVAPTQALTAAHRPTDEGGPRNDEIRDGTRPTPITVSVHTSSRRAP